MTRKQLKRNTVITQVIDGLITREKAAELLELSVRQIDRIKKSYLQEGVESLIHKNTGRKPAHALDEETKEKVIRECFIFRVNGFPIERMDIPRTAFPT